MLFEVLRANDNSVVMYTTSSSCVTAEDIDALSCAGYKFRVDNKIVSKQSAKLYASAEVHSDDISVDDSKRILTRYVRCVTTGEVFKNQSLAAKAYKIDPAQVSDSIKTGRVRSGYLFDYIYEGNGV